VCRSGDFQITPSQPRAPFDDVSGPDEDLNRWRLRPSRRSFARCIPPLFASTSFAELEHPLNCPRHFRRLDYLKWRAFREMEDSPFVGLTLPRIPVRLPHEGQRPPVSTVFASRSKPPIRPAGISLGQRRLCFGAVLVRAFSRSGWLQNIHGVERDVVGGGVVEGLPVHCFSTDPRDVARNARRT